MRRDTRSPSRRRLPFGNGWSAEPGWPWGRCLIVAPETSGRKPGTFPSPEPAMESRAVRPPFDKWAPHDAGMFGWKDERRIGRPGQRRAFPGRPHGSRIAPRTRSATEPDGKSLLRRGPARVEVGELPSAGHLRDVARRTRGGVEVQRAGRCRAVAPPTRPGRRLRTASTWSLTTSGPESDTQHVLAAGRGGCSPRPDVEELATGPRAKARVRTP